MPNKPKESEKPKTSILDRLPKDRGEYLEALIKYTVRAIRYPDDHMTKQAERLRAELAEWKKANPA